MTAEADWLERIEAAERAGELLQACDLAARGLAEAPDSDELKYRSILALARSGALTRAERLWRLYHLPRTDLRFAALGARLLRDRALRSRGERALALLRQAAEAYAALFRQSGSPFPGINAASLLALAGAREASETLARQVLEATRRERPTTPLEALNLAADQAAAHLILGEEAASAAAIAELCQAPQEAAALASTRRQLQQLVAALGRDPALLAPLRPRPSLHFTGHRMAPPGQPGRFPAHAEDRVAQAVAEALDRLRPGAGFGSLASGGDILVAEALLARGVPLHLVLPFDRESFIQESVASSGPAWVTRFGQVLDRAASVQQVTEGPFLGDAAIYAHTARLAMGLACLRSRIEAAVAHQLAIWDDLPAAGPAGTGLDVTIWRAAGLPTTRIFSHPDAPPPPSSAVAPDQPEHRLCAFLFGDFKGFSRLSEAELLAFHERLLPPLAAEIERQGAGVLARNTWGDGLFLVFEEVGAAALCAARLQRALRRLDRAAAGLPEDLGLRLALHAGPVFPLRDAITGQAGFAGRSISRTARMEPVTPEGEVYVSEAFAALLALDPPEGVSFEYVGLLPLAKQAGELRMYLLQDAEEG